MRSHPGLSSVLATLAAVMGALLPMGQAAAVGCPGGMTGSGTSGSPCLITTQTELAAMASGLGLTYQLDNSITLTGTWAPIAPYAMGGTTPFSGVLDGNGNTIAGLTTSDSTALAVGLFGVTAGATISNLRLTGVSLTGSQAVGSLIGIADNTTIDRVSVSGTITAVSGGVGGLIGYTYRLTGADPIAGGPTTISRASVSAVTSLTGASSTNAGGLVGIAYQPVAVSNSLVTGTIAAFDEVGGLSGTPNLSSTDSISTATLTVSAGQTKGGLVPSGGLPATRSYFDSAAAGTTSAGATGGVAKTPGQLKQISTYADWDIGVGWVPASDVWGICQSPNVRTVPFLNWTLNASPCTPAPPGTAPTVNTGSATAVSGNGATLSATVNANDDATSISIVTTPSAANAAARVGTSHTTTPSTTDGTSNTSVSAAVTGLQPNTAYYYWVSATNVWGSSTGSLGTFTTTDGPPPLVACTAYGWPGGNGTTGSPYLIDTYVDLYQATQCPTASFRQRADVSLELIANWTPIGDISTPFTGTYDGGRHQISGLTYSSTTGDFVGLFGATDGATIRNINALSGTVLGRASVGGLVGRAMNTTISHVHSAVAVTGDPSTPASGSAAAYHVGGLVGWMYGGSITGSSSTGSVTTTGDGASSGNYVGGVLGNGTDVTITDSWATGQVRGIMYIGGLAGQVSGASTVTRSNATGNVGTSGSGTAGGLIGIVEFTSGTPTVITDAFARGNVTTTRGGASNGGLVGYVRKGTITRAYSTGTISATGSSISPGGFVGAFAGIDATFVDSFWDTETSGKTDATSGGSTTGVTGESTANMKLLSTFTAAGWSMSASCTVTSSTWGLCETENGGYPFLPRAPEPDPTPDPTPSPEPSPSGPSNSGGGNATTTPTPTTTHTAQTSMTQGALGALALDRPLLPGRASAVRNGQTAEASARSGIAPNTLRLSGPGFTSQFTGIFRPGTSPRAKAFTPVVLRSRPVTLSGSGAAPGSVVALYLFSEPRLLATMTADGVGRFTGSFTVPSTSSLGDHALQLALRTAAGDTVNASVGVLVTKRALGTFTSTVHFTGTSATLTKSAKSTLTAFARTMTQAQDVRLTCTALIGSSKPDRAKRQNANARAQRVCGFLDDSLIRHVESTGASVQKVPGAKPGTVRVTATGTIT